MITVGPEILKLAKLKVAPTAPLKVVLPVVPVTVKARALAFNEFTALPKLMGPLPALKIVSAFKVTALLL